MKKAALVLSGGGSLGAAHMGAVKVLEAQFEFDFLAGVSAGAIVAAALACGHSASEISRIFQEQKLFRMIFELSAKNIGIFRGEKVLSFLREMFDDRSFSDLPSGTRLFLGATDFFTGERVTITSGNIAEAVRASIAVPVLFEPFLFEGKWLMDGGFSQNFPLDLALEQYSGDTIWGVDVCGYVSDGAEFFDSKNWKITQMRKLLERSFRILFKNQQHFPEDKRVRILRPNLSSFSSTDIRKLSEIEEKGRSEAEKFVQ